MKTSFEKTVADIAKAEAQVETVDIDNALDSITIEEELEEELFNLIQVKSINLRNAIKRVSYLLAEESEEEIKQKANLHARDEMLRSSFWAAHRRAEKNGTQMGELDIWKGICSRGYWERLVREYDYKLAYIITPVRDYGTMTRVIHEKGLEAMQRILSVDPVQKVRGKTVLDSKTAKMQIECFKLIDERLKGKAVERKQIHTTGGDQKPLSPQDTEKEIERLKLELAGGQQDVVTIDVSNDE